jgi:hypothetical protein
LHLRPWAVISRVHGLCDACPRSQAW